MLKLVTELGMLLNIAYYFAFVCIISEKQIAWNFDNVIGVDWRNLQITEY